MNGKRFLQHVYLGSNARYFYAFVAGPQESIVFSIRGDIRRMCVHCADPLDVPMPLDHEMDKEQAGSLRNASSAMALEFDHVSGSIFWSDRINQAIWTAFWDGTNQKVY